MKVKQPFARGEAKAINNLPDHILKTINRLTAEILLTATCDEKNESFIDPNLSLSAMQKALALLIAKFFKKEQIEGVVEQVCWALKSNVNDWKKDD